MILFNLYNRILLAKIELKSNTRENILFNKQQLDFYIKIYINQIYILFNKNYIKTILFIDIETSNRVFVNRKFVKLYKFSTILLRNSIKLSFANNKFVSYIIYAT